MANNNNDGDAMATNSSQPQQPPQLAELIQSLERATSMAKQLSLSSTDYNNNLNNIFASLTSAQLSLSSFISLHSSTTTAAGPDNSASFSDDEPMIAADDGGNCGGDDRDEDEDEEEEMNSKDFSMEKVEEKMRELFNVKCKRLKRPVSPSSVVAEERRRCVERENGRVLEVFDPIGTKLRNFDLIFQFHA